MAVALLVEATQSRSLAHGRGRGWAKQGLSRLGGFIDAVFAIAITLPIVQLAAPSVGPGKDLAAGYRQMLPEIIAYGLGFIVIGLFWNYSHFGARFLRRTDHGFNLLTLLFLACVSLTPLPARPYVEHFDDPANVGTAALVYGCCLAAPSIVWFVRWRWGVWRGLYDSELSERYVAKITLRYATAAAVALAGVVQLFAGYPSLGLLTVAVATASFVLPPSRPFMRKEA